MSDPLTTALVAASSSILASTLTIILVPTLQHYFWKRQRKDDLRLAAINEFNRVTNAYLATCITQIAGGLSPDDFVRDLNIAGATIRVLFSEAAYAAVIRLHPLIIPYASWQGPGRLQRGDQFSDACHAALTVMYREVVPI